LKSGLGDSAGLRSVDFRIVFAPEVTNSMSSLSPRSSFTRPKPKAECSSQSRDFQFIAVLDWRSTNPAAFFSVKNIPEKDDSAVQNSSLFELEPQDAGIREVTATWGTKQNASDSV
jgi:hypothetical protein